MTIVRSVQREAARTVIEAYAVGGGLIHNRKEQIAVGQMLDKLTARGG